MRRAIPLLARAVTPGERTRQRLLVAAVATAGTLLLAAARLVQLPGVHVDGVAPFVREPGLRVGVVTGTLLLVLPVVLLGAQALRLGSATRERRLAALHLAGATPGQLRVLAAFETGRAGAVGGVLAGPGYLGLWLLLGLLPGSGFRLLPPPLATDLAVWAGVVVFGGLAGVLAGHRRRVVAAVVALLGVGAMAYAVTRPSVVVALAVLLAVTAANPYRTPLATYAARLLRRRGRAVDVLAAARLRADPRPPGRVAAVLGLCGVSLGVQGGLAADVLGRDDAGFYLAGIGLAGAATAVAALVAVLSLVVAAADQVVAARRPVASLAAMGADPQVQRRVLRRQLTVVPLPAAVVGAGLGVLLTGAAAVADQGVTPGVLLCLLLPVPVAALAVVGLARVAVAVVAGPLRAAADPANLRAA